MQREHDFLADQTGVASSECISRVQLMRILEKLDYSTYRHLNEVYFEKPLLCEQRYWWAVDGKELRGSIDKAFGAKRGENVVFMVAHSNRHSRIVGYYSGQKESEKRLVNHYFKQQHDLASQAFSLDALHCHPALLREINEKEGAYLVQVKDNQPTLREDLAWLAQASPVQTTFHTVDKGHGRLEERKAWLYAVETACLEKRWHQAHLQSMIIVERSTEQLKTQRKTQEKACYISNLEVTPRNGQQLVQAIRGHWQIESNNYIRDTSFGEDRIRTKKPNLMRTMAACLNVAINQLQRCNQVGNLNITRENIAYDRELLYSCFNTS